MKKVFTLHRLLLLVLAFCLVLPGKACRFTVREIGFSVLSQTTYTLLIVDPTINESNATYQQLKRASRQSNIQVMLLHPSDDAMHPLIAQAKAQGITFPNAILCGPNDRFLPLYDASTYSLRTLKNKFEKEVIQSPLRQSLLENVHQTFAYVISVDGKDGDLNEQVYQQIDEACTRITDIMPIMPKKVESAPLVLTVPQSDFEKERVLLWSIGIDSIPQEPQAVVVYGRGRFMGTALTTEEISRDYVYKYLAMIGADCECNLDRKWMLGTQLPLLWDEHTRQHLATALTFDVDNPAILAEMSRILAKEEIGDAAAATGFTPETIDLDQAFGTDKEDKYMPTEEDDELMSTIYALTITFVVLFVLGVIISMYILRKKR